MSSPSLTVHKLTPSPMYDRKGTLIGYNWAQCPKPCLMPAEHPCHRTSKPCPDCAGSGRAPEYGETGWCIRCDGSGQIGAAL